MKKLYYVAPFILILILVMLMELLDNMGIVELSAYAVTVTMILFAAIWGFFSPTHKKFDYWITAIMPIALCCVMFIVGFLDKDDLETRYNLYEAVKAISLPYILQLYILMPIVTFFASYMSFRNLKNRTCFFRSKCVY